MSSITGLRPTEMTQNNSTPTTKKTNEMGKDDFLKLLVTQLRYQDPMSPMEDKDFIAQMAQFSSLEQMQNMNNAIATTQATTLIGKKVGWANEETGDMLSGVVKGVHMVDGQVNLVVAINDKIGTYVKPDKVLAVENVE